MLLKLNDYDGNDDNGNNNDNDEDGVDHSTTPRHNAPPYSVVTVVLQMFPEAAFGFTASSRGHVGYRTLYRLSNTLTPSY